MIIDKRQKEINHFKIERLQKKQKTRRKYSYASKLSTNSFDETSFFVWSIWSTWSIWIDQFDQFAWDRSTWSTCMKLFSITDFLVYFYSIKSSLIYQIFKSTNLLTSVLREQMIVLRQFASKHVNHFVSRIMIYRKNN